jgi:hypothetical protein
MKHTPGPWKFDIEPRGKGWPGLFQVTTNILEYGLDGEEGIYIDNPADARLLAAAPEMLEILKLVVSVSQHDATLITRQVADRMKAIVAKAEGVVDGASQRGYQLGRRDASRGPLG